MARWFDPSLGRFTSPDSIVPTSTQGTQAWDRYAFVNNNPVRYNDPTGHQATNCPENPCNDTGGGGSGGVSGSGTSQDGEELIINYTRRQVYEIGETYGEDAALADGLESVGWENPLANRGGFGQGFDDIMVDSEGNLNILEYKGGTSRLAPKQMTRGWIEKNAHLLQRFGDPMGDEILAALDNGTVIGRVYTTRIHLGVILETVSRILTY